MRLTWTAAFCAALAASSRPIGAQQGGFSDPSRLAKLRASLPAVDSIMRRFTEQQHIPGAAWGIVVDGKVMHIGVTGLRDVEAKSPVDSNTVFRIASMTKSFTAMAIVKLRDDGKLSLDDPAEKYVPEMKSLKYPTADSPKITIRHLLSHAEGFPEDNPWGDQQLARSEAELTRMIAGGIPFSNTPGVAYEYSNYGFAILGRIVTRASGMPYNEYITANILRPLGMRSTTYSPTAVAPNRLAHGYRWEDERWKEEPQLPDGSFGSMGGMLTSISDLSTWVSAFLGAWPPRDGAETGPVKRASLREMQQVWRPAPTTAGRDAAGNLRLNAGGYAYGLRVSTNCLFAHIVAHSGGLPGFGSQMRWLPDYGVGIIAFGNRTYAGWGAPIDAALDVFARAGALEPRMAEPSPALNAAREQVTRLVMKWDAGLAQSLAADNLFLDRSADRRSAEIAAHLERVGSCKAPASFAYVENALRGQWILECERGNLLVSITLAPTMPPTVQYLEVTRAPAGGAAALRPKTCS